MSQVISHLGFIDDIWTDVEIPSLAEYDGGAFLFLKPDDDINALGLDLSQIDLIVISFGTSADGRRFSQAALLRSFGYTGHIRARGHILVDQFRAALHRGINDIEISQEQSLRNPENQWMSVSLETGYQTHLHPLES